MKFIFFSLCSLFFLSQSIAQTFSCGTSQYPKNANSEKLFLKEELKFEAYIEKNKDHLIFRSTPIIPIVFHILYNTASQDFSDAQVKKQLDILNRDFAR